MSSEQVGLGLVRSDQSIAFLVVVLAGGVGRVYHGRQVRGLAGSVTGAVAVVAHEQGVRKLLVQLVAVVRQQCTDAGVCQGLAPLAHQLPRGPGQGLVLPSQFCPEGDALFL